MTNPDAPAHPPGTIEDVFMPVDITDETTDHTGFRTVTTTSYQETKSGLKARRELVRAPQAVAVVVYDPALDRLVMIKQFRLGAQLALGRGFCVEVVAGLIDPGEEPGQTAIRELKEEAGLDAVRVEKLCAFLTTPGLTDEVIHLYYAQVDASNLVSVAGVEGESEKTFPITLTLEEALSAVDDNRILNGIAMVALLIFARHQSRLIGK
ncbi:MAG: NUDIX hydrolase [Pseudomonadota bacterium]